MKRTIIVLLIFISICAIAQKQSPTKTAKASSSATCSKDVRAAVIGSVHAIDEMGISDAELAWQFERIEAQKAASRVVQLAESRTELKASAFLLAAYQGQVACRALFKAGESHDGLVAKGCWKQSSDQEKNAMDNCSLQLNHVYPRVSDFE